MARVAADQLRQGIGHVLEEGGRQPAGGRRAERVAVQTGVGRVDPALLTGQPDLDRAALAPEFLEHRRRVEAVDHPQLRLLRAQVAEPAEHVVQLIARGRTPHVREELKVVLDLLQGVWVDQIAQLLLTEQLAQQFAIER